ncbi:hypothetical protein Rhe02_97950 [Rhizocola hellebori]|uniref:Pyrrolo-quinoline quinone repeat domain-containing protein n=2 Tax=Rhizocola hellebori TaxID=1392758 RepID=A0A8J3VN18_9ACTN|nr:hypothetical protein Rhe02_97950 [Rhizocola hellebori]
MTLLVSTGIWNPFPGLWAWFSESRPLAEPALQWQERLGGVPKTVTILDRFVVVEQRESVEVRTRLAGRRVWEAKADWATVAGSPEREVVVSGTLLKKGYEVRDPATGRVIRTDDKAAAVWSFSDGLIEVSCFTPKDCELTAKEPVSGDELWRTGLPGIGFVLFADNPKLAQGAVMTSDRFDAKAEPRPMPKVLGFPIDNRIHPVDTLERKALPVVEPDGHTSVTVLGGRIVYSIATPRDGTCLVTVSGRDGATGKEVWVKHGYQLRTISGAGCDQRKEPVAGGNAVVALRPDGREALLDAADGREVLTAEVGEKILATDGIRAVVRSADGSKITTFLLGRETALWSRKASDKSSVAVTRNAVILADRSPDRIIVLDPTSGRVLKDVRSAAKVVASDNRALLLADRRDLGYLPFNQ